VWVSASDQRTAATGDSSNVADTGQRVAPRTTVLDPDTTDSTDATEEAANGDAANGDAAGDGDGGRPSRWSLLASTLRRELRGDGAHEADADGDAGDIASDVPGDEIAASGRGDGAPGNGAGPVDRTTTLPDIVPATVDVPEEQTLARPPVVLPVVDDPDEWTEMPDDAVVRVPRDANAVPLRPVGRRPRVRKVTRVLRHVDPWSTFKVALIFSAVLYAVMLTAGVLLWNVALNTGTVDNVERWFTQFGWETFELDGGDLFHNAWIAGLFAMVGLTAFAVLGATLFNLVSDIVGGVRMTVLEEEVVERTISPSRRFVVRRAPSAAAWEPEPVEDHAT
jgi:hypothetical protein